MSSHAFLRSLYEQVRDLNPDFPSSDEIQRLGIQAREVSLNDTDNKTLDFEPCYFKADPINFLELCLLSLDPEDSTALLDIQPPRSIQDLMNEHPDCYDNDAILAPSYENLTDWDQCIYEVERSALDQAREVQDEIDRHIWDRRPVLGIASEDELLNELLKELVGVLLDKLDELLDESSSQGLYLPEHFSLKELTNQKRWCIEDRRRKNDPVYREGDFHFSKTWQIEHHYVYTGLPHSILSCLAHIKPTETQKGLTTHELRVIVNSMVLRVNHTPFRRCGYPIHTILILSYLGDFKGKIIQASYDGNGLILQYSPLWNFLDSSAPRFPAELFVRHRLSRPTWPLALHD